MKNNRDKIINSLIKSDEFEKSSDKLIVIQSIKLFFDKYNFEDFFYERDFTYKEYKQYFKPILKELSVKNDKQIKKEIKKTEKKK